jgi:ATP-binding cassette, subfamily C (CFTR/MRP), member 1
MLVMIVLEIRIYIYEFRWYIRFVIIYVLVGEAAMFNLVLLVRRYYSSRYSTFVKFVFLMKLFLL